MTCSNQSHGFRAFLNINNYDKCICDYNEEWIQLVKTLIIHMVSIVFDNPEKAVLAINNTFPNYLHCR